MKFIFTFVCLFAIQVLFAQKKPNFFPEDINHEEVRLRFFSTPGILNKSRSKGMEIAYTWLGNGTFEDEDGNVSAPYSEYKNWNQLDFGLKMPIIHKDQFKLLLSYKYNVESFDISSLGADFPETFQELNDKRLKKNSLGIILTKPLNETNYLAFRLGYSTNGNYAGLMNFDSKYAIYKALALFGVKPHDNFEWGIGLSYSQSFRKSSVVPFLLYNRSFNNRWGIESVFPSYIYGRYNLGKKSIFLFGVDYNSQSYRMKSTLSDYAMNHSEVLGMLRLEKQIVPWVWANAKLGYQLNFSTDFESKNDISTPFKVEPTNGIFFQIGIFLSPPDEFFQNR